MVSVGESFEIRALRDLFDHLVSVQPGSYYLIETEVIYYQGSDPARRPACFISAHEYFVSLEKLGDIGREVWPDVIPELAARRLFSINVLEYVDTQPEGVLGYMFRDGKFNAWN